MNESQVYLLQSETNETVEASLLDEVTDEHAPSGGTLAALALLLRPLTVLMRSRQESVSPTRSWY